MTPPRVAVGVSLPFKTKWSDRWFHCYQRFSYPNKTCLVSSENPSFLEQVKKQYPFAQTIPFTFYRPPWQNNRVYAITEGRDALRRYVCDHSEIAYLLMIDGDVETPTNTIQMLYDIARQGHDFVYSREVGLIALMHRDVCESVRFVTGVCRRDSTVYLEETDQVIGQMKQYNTWRVNVLKKPIVFKIYRFECKWAKHKDNPLGKY